LVEREGVPAWLGGGFAKMEADFEARNRVGEAQDGFGVGGFGGREEPEAFPARPGGGAEESAVAADRQRAPLECEFIENH